MRDGGVARVDEIVVIGSVADLVAALAPVEGIQEPGEPLAIALAVIGARADTRGRQGRGVGAQDEPLGLGLGDVVGRGVGLLAEVFRQPGRGRFVDEVVGRVG